MTVTFVTSRVIGAERDKTPQIKKAKKNTVFDIAQLNRLFFHETAFQIDPNILPRRYE